MATVAGDTCQCGSGLSFSRCHGDSRNENAREQALQEAAAVAGLFPGLRPRGSAVEDFLDRIAATHPGDDELPDVLVGGVDLLGDSERRRLIESWAGPYEDRWHSLVNASGDVAGAERALCVGALRAAVAERQPTPRGLLATLESGALRRSPFAALGLALEPALVWSYDEARAASTAQEGRRRWKERSRVVEEVAYALMTFDHVRRTRTTAARLGAELPAEGLPIASELLGTACAEVVRDDSAARSVAAALLLGYVERLRLSPTIG